MTLPFSIQGMYGFILTALHAITMKDYSKCIDQVNQFLILSNDKDVPKELLKSMEKHRKLINDILSQDLSEIDKANKLKNELLDLQIIIDDYKSKNF